VLHLKSQGYTSSDWLTGRLTAEEVEETVQQIALLHAAGLAYRSVVQQIDGRCLCKEEFIFT
jgi:hypothetical protein